MKIREVQHALLADIYKLSRRNIHHMKNLKPLSFAFKIRKAISAMLAERLELVGGGRFF